MHLVDVDVLFQKKETALINSFEEFPKEIHLLLTFCFTDVELSIDLDVSGMLFGEALKLAMDANAIIESSSMFTMAFTGAVQTADVDALLAGLTLQLSNRTGL